MEEASSAPPNAPASDRERDAAALLIIDMINGFDFPGAATLKSRALDIASNILALRAEFERASLPVIYVNDNFGEWHSERSRLVERALEQDGAVARKLAPETNDYFIIKPQFSGFYSTNLPVLLPKLGVSRLVLTGIATDICVLFTAADAHMRDYALWIPENCVAAEHDARGQSALAIMRETMDAETAASSELALDEWMARRDRADREAGGSAR
jgi:nicotinamidase-related amidase